MMVTISGAISLVSFMVMIKGQTPEKRKAVLNFLKSNPGGIYKVLATEEGNEDVQVLCLKERYEEVKQRIENNNWD